MSKGYDISFVSVNTEIAESIHAGRAASRR
jgi:hypothetical protein